MRVAYLLLSHSNPPQIVRLANTLLAGDPACRVVIHHDSGRTDFDGHGLEDAERVDVLGFERNITWGGFAMSRATIASLRWIRERIAPDWTIFVSGQDYPARSAAELHATLERTSADALLTIYTVVDANRPAQPQPESWHARYYYRWYRLPRIALLSRLLRSERCARWAWRLSWSQPLVYVWTLPRDAGTAIGIRRLRTPFAPDFRCYVGSQWCALNRFALERLLDSLSARPDLLRFYARTIVSDESLITSTLMNDPLVRIATPNLSYLRFEDETSAHPAVMTIDDLDAIEASGAFFTRKVDGTDSALLDALDSRVDPRLPGSQTPLQTLTDRRPILG